MASASVAVLSGHARQLRPSRVSWSLSSEQKTRMEKQKLFENAPDRKSSREGLFSFSFLNGHRETVARRYKRAVVVAGTNQPHPLSDPGSTAILSYLPIDGCSGNAQALNHHPITNKSFTKPRSHHPVKPSPHSSFARGAASPATSSFFLSLGVSLSYHSQLS